MEGLGAESALSSCGCCSATANHPAGWATDGEFRIFSRFLFLFNFKYMMGIPSGTASAPGTSGSALRLASR